MGYKPYLFEWGILYLRLLRNLFCPFGSIEMHGCNVANGRKGELFIKKLATDLGMPVTAGKGSQYSNISIKSIFRFEGSLILTILEE